MTGIYGFAADRGLEDPAAILDRMLGAVPSFRPPSKRVWTAPRGHAGIGGLRPPGADADSCLAADPKTGTVCAVDGVVYRAADGPESDLVEVNAATALLNRYLRSGAACLRETSGSFSVVWWEEKTRRLVLANDKLATNLLFYAHRAGTLVFASTLARILKVGTFTPEIDPEGLADLLAFKHIFGSRTLFRDVRVLPAASVLTLEGNTLRIEKYWRLDDVRTKGRYDESRLDELEPVFKRAVKRALRPDRTSVVALSGGLDSRCIVAAAANQGLSYLTFSYGLAEGTDRVLAREVAARAGVRHLERPIDAGRLGEWLVPMVIHQGGIMSTLDSYPCQHLGAELPFDAVVTGRVGETARGAWAYPAGLGVRDLSGAIAVLGSHIWSTTAQRLDLVSLWRPEYRGLIGNVPAEHLQAAVSGYSYRDTPLAAHDYFLLDEHARKFLGKVTAIWRVNVDSYLPYLDHEWVESVLAIPFSERLTKTIQVDLIRRLCPVLLTIPHTKTLLPLSASPWRVTASHTYRRIKRGVSRRLGLASLDGGVVDTLSPLRWSRAEMRSTLVGLLYDRDAAFREFLMWDAVKPLLDAHFSGKDNWLHLVSGLTVFEIAHGLWCDPGTKAGKLDSLGLQS